MIPNLKQVAPGILRGGQPESESDWLALKDSGITDVIKLNTSDSMQPDEGAVLVGLRVFYSPMSLTQQIFTEPDLQEILDVIGFIKPGTFIHCEHGQDRSGLIVALYRVLVQHWKPEDARHEMAECGFHRSLLGLEKAWYDLTNKNRKTP